MGDSKQMEALNLLFAEIRKALESVPSPAVDEALRLAGFTECSREVTIDVTPDDGAVAFLFVMKRGDQ